MIASFIDGPLWYFSATVFVIGVVWRLFAILRLRGRKKVLSKPRNTTGGGALATILRRFVPYREFATVSRSRFVAGYAFHLGLFALLFFAAPHMEFIRDRITGFGWTPLPYWGFIVASQLAFFGLLFLIIYRIMNPVTRLLSDSGDYLASILVFIVMLTGCMALLQDNEALRLLHLFTAEVLLIYFPFSTLMHTFTFLTSRGFSGAVFYRRGVNY
jgi:nitrate reductase gamma subunit